MKPVTSNQCPADRQQPTPRFGSRGIHAGPVLPAMGGEKALAAGSGDGPDVGVVIVNWNAGDDLAVCVENLRSGVGGRIEHVVVVDNGSVDDSLARLAAPPGVTVVEARRNLGFAAGANLGAARCRGHLLLFVNPDLRVLPGAIDLCVRYLREHPEVGIVGPLLVDGGGQWQPSAGRFSALGHLLLDTGLARREPRTDQLVDWIHGAFLLVRRPLFEQLGGFDERFFMYGEDMDFCARARALGFRTAIVPAARALHYGNRSGALRFGDDRDAEVLKGEIRFYAASGRRGELLVFRAVALMKFMTKNVAYLLRGDRQAAGRTWRVVRACMASDFRGPAVEPRG